MTPPEIAIQKLPCKLQAVPDHHVEIFPIALPNRGFETDPPRKEGHLDQSSYHSLVRPTTMILIIREWMQQVRRGLESNKIIWNIHVLDIRIMELCFHVCLRVAIGLTYEANHPYGAQLVFISLKRLIQLTIQSNALP